MINRLVNKTAARSRGMLLSPQELNIGGPKCSMLEKVKEGGHIISNEIGSTCNLEASVFLMIHIYIMNNIK